MIREELFDKYSAAVTRILEADSSWKGLRRIMEFGEIPLFRARSQRCVGTSTREWMYSDSSPKAFPSFRLIESEGSIDGCAEDFCEKIESLLNSFRQQNIVEEECILFNKGEPLIALVDIDSVTVKQHIGLFGPLRNE